MAEQQASGDITIPAVTVSADSGAFNNDKLDEIIDLLCVLISKCGK